MSVVAERLGWVVVPRSPVPSRSVVSAADRAAPSPTLLELPELLLTPRAAPLPSLADSPRVVVVAAPRSGVPRVVRLPAAPTRSAGKRWVISESRLSPPRSYAWRSDGSRVSLRSSWVLASRTATGLAASNSPLSKVWKSLP
jgi:hypothetical protein